MTNQEILNAIKDFSEDFPKEALKAMQATSFFVYDERFMVHYRSGEWVSALAELIEDSDSEEMQTIKQRAEDVLQRFS